MTTWLAIVWFVLLLAAELRSLILRHRVPLAVLRASLAGVALLGFAIWRARTDRFTPEVWYAIGATSLVPCAGLAVVSSARTLASLPLRATAALTLAACATAALVLMLLHTGRESLVTLATFTVSVFGAGVLAAHLLHDDGFLHHRSGRFRWGWWVPIVVALPLAVAIGAGIAIGRRRGPTPRARGLEWVASQRGMVFLAELPPHCPTGTVPILRGTFRMGSPEGEGEADEHPAHEETVDSFCLDVTEVTVGAYAGCVRAGGCSAPNTGGSCNWGRGDRSQHPVNCVDWEQSRRYCAWSGGRLPTEVEWEYAARGTDGRRYSWGNDEPGNQLCWQQFDGTCAVGSHPAGRSPFGVEDMAGNVWEWTATVYGPYLADAGASVDETRRVLRGGGWGISVPSWVRAAFRNLLGVTSRSDYIGFRCARGVMSSSTSSP